MCSLQKLLRGFERLWKSCARQLVLDAITAIIQGFDAANKQRQDKMVATTEHQTIEYIFEDSLH